MKPGSRDVLARDATWTLDNGACKELTTTWTHHENTYAAARNHASRQIALRAAAQICAHCPITVECAELAELIRYTGIAAGHVYRNGRRHTGPTDDQAHTA